MPDVKVHLDTDFGGDPDDACALVMLLGRADVEVVAITTVLDSGGERAGCVRAVLELCGRDEIPVAQGAMNPLRSTASFASTAGDFRYWPDGIVRAPSREGAAAELIAASVASGATVVAIGPYTNLAIAEQRHPGALGPADVVVMGGWIAPPSDEFPQWGPARDFNVQTDVEAALRVIETAGRITLSTLPETMPAQLTEAQLDVIEEGALGRLLARQSRLHAVDTGKVDLRGKWPGVASDFVNFHWDPVACAVACNSDSAHTASYRLEPVVEDGVLRFVQSGSGREMAALVRVDGDAFAREWIAAVRAVDG